jgi:hypothetical protein
MRAKFRRFRGEVFDTLRKSGHRVVQDFICCGTHAASPGVLKMIQATLVAPLLLHKIGRNIYFIKQNVFHIMK